MVNNYQLSQSANLQSSVYAFYAAVYAADKMKYQISPTKMAWVIVSAANWWKPSCNAEKTKRIRLLAAVDIPANIRLVGCLYAVNANATSRKEAKCKSHLAKNDTAWYNQIQGFSTINWVCLAHGEADLVSCTYCNECFICRLIWTNE